MSARRAWMPSTSISRTFSRKSRSRVSVLTCGRTAPQHRAGHPHAVLRLQGSVRLSPTQGLLVLQQARCSGLA